MGGLLIFSAKGADMAGAGLVGYWIMGTTHEDKRGAILLIR